MPFFGWVSHNIQLTFYDVACSSSLVVWSDVCRAEGSSLLWDLRSSGQFALCLSGWSILLGRAVLSVFRQRDRPWCKRLDEDREKSRCLVPGLFRI